jgi:hypothetical protein
MAIRLSPGELENKITSEKLRPVQIISIALATGVIIFFIICFILYSMQTVDAQSGNLSSEFMNVLVYALIAICAGMYSAAFKLPDIQISKSVEALKNSQETGDSLVDKLLGLHRIYMIIRYALMEGTALIGLVILIISITSGAVYSNSMYWLTALPALIFVAFIAFSFPTKEKVITFINIKFMN